MRYQYQNNGFLPMHPGTPYQGGYHEQMPYPPYQYGMQQPYGYQGHGYGQLPQVPIPNNIVPYQPPPQMGSVPHHYGGLNPLNQLFHNPLQPEDGYQYAQYGNAGGYQNPYPQPAQMQKPPGGNFSSILNSFKSQDGNLDINKMVNTTGQMMNALTQVSGMVKGLGGIFKV